MEFGIGFVMGGLLSGLATAKSKDIVSASHGLLSKAAALGQKIALKAASFRSKL